MVNEHIKLGMKLEDDMLMEEHYNFLITPEAENYMKGTSKKFIYRFLQDQGVKGLRNYLAIEYPPEEMANEVQKLSSADLVEMVEYDEVKFEPGA